MTSLHFISQKNRPANKILIIIIGLATFTFAGKMALFQIDASWIWRPSLLSDCSIYLFGPLLYMYFKALVFKDYSKNILAFKHYIPSLLMFLFFCWTLTISTETYYKMSYTLGMGIVYLIMELTGVISLIVYAIASFKIVKQIKNSDDETSPYKEEIARFIQYILIGLLLIIIFWSFGIFKTYILHALDSYIVYQLVWISMAVFLFIVGYFSFTQPEIIRLPVKKREATRNRLTTEEIIQIQQKLQILIEEEEIFTRSDLSLKILSKQLGTSSNNLSWLLNSVYEKTFYEYINEFRVKAFLQKIEAGKHKKQTLLSIAMDAGFNSKSTFNKTFKLLMNDTPSRYIEKKYL